MMKIPHFVDDAIRLRYVPFALKDLAKKWRQYQILYNSLDYSTKTLLEIICQGGFFQKDENEGWDLYENLVEKII